MKTFFLLKIVTLYELGTILQRFLLGTLTVSLFLQIGLPINLIPELIEGNTPNIVVSDYVVPGKEAVKCIRSNRSDKAMIC